MAQSNGPRWAMVVDLRRCIGCNACTVACKAEFGTPLGVWRTWVKVVEKGKYPMVTRSFLPLFCNHCERPICLRNCPVQATWQRPDGIVLIDPHRCIGCKYCIASCPYEARFFNPLKRIVQMCEFCRHRVDAGLQPACVATCPTGALIFGDLRDPESAVSRLVATSPVQTLKPEKATGPQIFYIAADMAAMRSYGLPEGRG